MSREATAIDFAAQLASVPVRNARVRQVGESEEGLLVETDLTYRGWQRLLVRPLKLSRQKRFLLQGVGLELYRAVDGTATVEALVDRFMIVHGLTFFEARALVTQYLATLMRRGLIVVAQVSSNVPPLERPALYKRGL